jgi:hypothetical protein
MNDDSESELKKDALDGPSFLKPPQARRSFIVGCLIVALLTLLLVADLIIALAGLKNAEVGHAVIWLHPELSAERDLEINLVARGFNSGVLFSVDIEHLECAVEYSQDGNRRYLTTFTQLPVVDFKRSKQARNYDLFFHDSNFKEMRSLLWNASSLSLPYNIDFLCLLDLRVYLGSNDAAFSIPLSQQSLTYRAYSSDSALDGTAPDGAVPDGTASDGTAPNGTAPDGTALNSTTTASSSTATSSILTLADYSARKVNFFVNVPLDSSIGPFDYFEVHSKDVVLSTNRSADVAWELKFKVEGSFGLS